MTEPSSSAAAGLVGYKLGAGILGIGVVTAALGFLVLLPKTAKEAAVRAMATMIGSALLGPVLVISAYFGIGLLVAASRFAFPDRTVGVHTSAPAQPAVDTAAAASEEVQERELIAA